MRRKEREVTDEAEINAVIDGCDCIRLGLLDDEGVYIVPMSFGIETADGRTFYFHGAREGRKALCLAAAEKEGKSVSFEMDFCHGIKTGESACAHSAYYKCIMGCGKVQCIEDNEEKRQAFDAIMAHNTGEKKHWDIPDAMLSRVGVWALHVTEISCKEHCHA